MLDYKDKFHAQNKISRLKKVTKIMRKRLFIGLLSLLVGISLKLGDSKKGKR